MTYFKQAFLINKQVLQSRICLLRQVLGKYRCCSTVYMLNLDIMGIVL